MRRLVFSGHDTFHCRQFWLKKAYDFQASNKSFNDDEASLDLGVGKNMVTAIRYWSRCFQMIDDENKPSQLSTNLLSDGGWDPYLEDHGSLWLLHWLLITSENASTFTIIFNELIKERPEFTADNFVQVVNRKDGDYNKNTLNKDFTVFYRTYFADFKSNDLEEGFTGILTELNILKQIRKSFIDKDGKAKAKDVWLLERSIRNEIPLHILLFGILSNHPNDRSISFEDLYNGKNEIGSVFALSKEGLTAALERMSEELDYGIVFSNEAGIRELQFKNDLNAGQILEDYYGS
jgi:hypothetical protein